MNQSSFPKTESHSLRQFPAVVVGCDSPKGLGTAGYEPLMRNLRAAHVIDRHRDRVTAGNTFHSCASPPQRLKRMSGLHAAELAHNTGSVASYFESGGVNWLLSPWLALLEYDRPALNLSSDFESSLAHASRDRSGQAHESRPALNSTSANRDGLPMHNRMDSGGGR